MVPATVAAGPMARWQGGASKGEKKHRGALNLQLEETRKRVEMIVKSKKIDTLCILKKTQ